MKQTNPKDEFIARAIEESRNKFNWEAIFPKESTAQKLNEDFWTQKVSESWDKGKDEKLSSTYNSSKVYLMGYEEAKNDLIEWCEKQRIEKNTFPQESYVTAMCDLINHLKSL